MAASPSATRAPTWLFAKPIAHRGLHGAGKPENSLPAFEAAVSAGFPIELDVRRTADGVAVVFHDANLGRLVGKNLSIGECFWKNLAELRVENERIPRLEEVLDLVADRVPLLIELKVDRFTGADEAALARALAGRPARIAVQSFHPLTVFWFRLRYPHIPRGQISCAYENDHRPRWLTGLLSFYAFNAWTRPHFLADHLARLPHRRVSKLRRRFPLLAWTVRSPEEASFARRLSDNYIFENFVPN